jgi:hypothetical protein
MKVAAVLVVSGFQSLLLRRDKNRLIRGYSDHPRYRYPLYDALTRISPVHDWPTVRQVAHTSYHRPTVDQSGLRRQTHSHPSLPFKLSRQSASLYTRFSATHSNRLETHHLHPNRSKSCCRKSLLRRYCPRGMLPLKPALRSSVYSCSEDMVTAPPKSWETLN